MEEELNLNNKESIFEALQQIAKNGSANLSILEDRIDVKIQMEYFKLSKRIKENLDKEEIIHRSKDVFNAELSIEEKKELLLSLASIDDVKIYRLIEKYTKNPDKELNDWAILALQESRMHLESSLLDQNQVFISTGLGGKGLNLRYFVVFISKDDRIINETQKKIIQSELEYTLTKNESLLEKIEFNDKYTAFSVLIPITISIGDLFKGTISECNKLGNFLKNNFLITNMKEFSMDEIEQFINDPKRNDLLNSQ
jgi:hypothetical protein